MIRIAILVVKIDVKNTVGCWKRQEKTTKASHIKHATGENRTFFFIFFSTFLSFGVGKQQTTTDLWAHIVWNNTEKLRLRITWSSNWKSSYWSFGPFCWIFISNVWSVECGLALTICAHIKTNAFKKCKKCRAIYWTKCNLLFCNCKHSAWFIRIDLFCVASPAEYVGGCAMPFKVKTHCAWVTNDLWK